MDGRLRGHDGVGWVLGPSIGPVLAKPGVEWVGVSVEFVGLNRSR